MAISFVRNSGQVATTSPLGGGAVALPITAGAVGNTLVVAVATAAATGAASCSDSSGTTYNLDAEITSGVAITVMIFSARITTGGVTSISINGFGASLLVEAAAFELSGFKTTSWLDTKGTGSGVGTSVSAGPTTGNLLEGDAWIGVFGSTASLGTFTAGGSATALTGADQTGGSLGAEYLLTPAAGSKATATGTFSATGTWAGLVAAYQAAPAPVAVSLNPAAGSSGGNLAATAPTAVALSAAGGVSSGSIFLDYYLDLFPAKATTGASLSLITAEQISLSAAASSGASLAATAPTRIAMNAAAGQSEAGGEGLEPSEELFAGEETFLGQPDLQLTAPTFAPLNAAAGTSSAAITATTTAPVPLNATQCVSGGALTATTSGTTPLEPATGQSTAALGITARTQIPLEPSAGVGGGSVFLNAHISLHAAEAASSGTLNTTATTSLPLTAATALSTGSLADTAATDIPLNAAIGVSEAGTPTYIGEEQFPSEELSLGVGPLALYTPTQLMLQPANASSTGSLKVRTTPNLQGLVNPRAVAGVIQ